MTPELMEAGAKARADYEQRLLKDKGKGGGFGSNIDLLRLSEPDIAQIGVGRKFQKPTVCEQLSVFENLELNLHADRRVKASLFSRLSGEQLDKLGEVLTLIHLKSEAQRTADLLSHGQKQWLEIGILLAQDPKLLLLDEPVAGMTDEETERTAELLLTLEGQHSLVVVEHDMRFVDQLTQGRKKVTVLHEGSMLADRKTMAIVLVEQHYDFAAELADQYLVMERGEVVMRGRGADMAADGVRDRMSI